jgi:hypothetical protein
LFFTLNWFSGKREYLLSINSICYGNQQTSRGKCIDK